MVGFCVRDLLHYRSVLHARVHHAEVPTAHGAQKRIKKPGETVPVHGADVYCDLFWIIGAMRALCDESDASLVLQYERDV